LLHPAPGRGATFSSQLLIFIIMTREQLIPAVKNEMNPAMLNNAAVYVLAFPLHGGVPVEINRQSITPDKNAQLIFVDLKPGANWAHPCRYILIDDNGSHSFDSSFPPDINNYRLLLKGSNVENWMLLTTAEAS